MSDSDNIRKKETGNSVDDARGSKRHSETETKNVHSANDWEHVDLGDEGRKSKFLRLMGANKKEHHGRIVIGEKKSSVVRGRSNEDNERLNTDLEDQYRHGLDMKMSGCARRHTGLGFAEPEPEEPPSSETQSEAGTDVTESTDGDGVVGVPATTVEKTSVEDEKRSERQKDSSETGSKSSSAEKPSVIGFVHSSSSS